MKNWLRKNMFALCSACMAGSIMVYFGSGSYFFFGESEFPVEE